MDTKVFPGAGVVLHTLSISHEKTIPSKRQRASHSLNENNSRCLRSVTSGTEQQSHENPCSASAEGRLLFYGLLFQSMNDFDLSSTRKT